MHVYMYVLCMYALCVNVCNLRTYVPEGRLSGRLANRYVQQTVVQRCTNCPAPKITELKAAWYLCAVRAKHFAWKRQNDELPRFWHKSHRFAGTGVIPRNRGSIPGTCKGIPPQRSQAGSAAHPATYSMGVRGLFPGEQRGRSVTLNTNSNISSKVKNE